MTPRHLRSVLLQVLKVSAVLVATQAWAQDAPDPDAVAAEIERGRIVYQRVGYCVTCHGWAGDGKSGASPMAHAAAANLRETQLDKEGLIEVVSCGLPGTRMPYHDGSAYKTDKCYGLTEADFEPGQAPSRGKTMRQKDVLALVAYLQAQVVGRAKPNYEECADYYRDSADKACLYLKSE